MTDQTRADFEAHFQLTTRQAWQHPDGSYKFPEIQAKWEGYQAGVASVPDRRELQAKGEHPAPCARFCESNSYEIELRQLKARLARALAAAAPTKTDTKGR